MTEPVSPRDISRARTAEILAMLDKALTDNAELPVAPPT